MMISSFSRASVVAIKVHANGIVFHLYTFQEAFLRDSNTKGRSILRGRQYGVQTVVLFLY